MDGERIKHYLSYITNNDDTSYSDLYKRLHEDLRKQSQGFHYIKQASGELRRRLSCGELQAWGNYRLSSESMSLQRSHIKSSFWKPGIVISHDGTVTEHNMSGIAYNNLIFDTAEVLGIWTEPFGSNQPDGSSETRTENALADDNRRKGGRPPHERQVDFVRELLRLANTPDGLPEDKGVLQKNMEEWSAAKFQEGGPSRSTIQNWLNLYDYRSQKPK